ncbi:helix-turn-helix domain-containing protein [Paenibacillus sp. IHBB 3054]|uniref:helix-turn-helix domain-containing protein n=1 Tax=Paenibacillus sp. IHBB 3054 TaxID=3425689 RepID=UPI003F671B8F
MDHSFGEYLRMLRRSKGMNSKEVAERAGVVASYITMVETGKRGVPNPDMLRKLSAIFNCSYLGMMIKAGHISEEEVLGYREQEQRARQKGATQ